MDLMATDTSVQWIPGGSQDADRCCHFTHDTTPTVQRALMYSAKALATCQVQRMRVSVYVSRHHK